jgi:hypothetical protein
MALDGGSTVTNGTGPTVVTLTTTGGSGTVVVGAVVSGSTTVASVVGLGLTFTASSANPVSVNATDKAYLFTAPYTSNVSGSITVTLVGTGYNVVSVMGISGTKTTAAIDGAAVGAVGSGPAITTTNANDAVVAILEVSGVAASPGAGWLASPGSDSTLYVFMEYRFASSIGTYTASMSAGTILGGIITAIRQGP